MARLFGRVVEVNIGGVAISALRIDFDIRRRTSGEPPGGEVIVNNLSDRYLDELSKAGLPVTVAAGYGDSVGEIFSGLIVKAEHTRSAGGNARHLKLYLGNMSAVSKQVTLTAVVMGSHEYARRIARQIGADIDLTGMPNVQLRSQAHSVPGRQALTDLCEKITVMAKRRIYWRDDDGVIRFGARGAATKTASRLTISPATGLVGSPEDTDDDGVKIHTLLNHEAQIGSTVTLTGLGETPRKRSERRELRIMEIRHHGTNWVGQFRTTMELRPITDNPPQ